MKLVNSITHKPNLTIEFEPDELDALFAVLDKVGGDQDISGRRHIKELTKIIRSAGYCAENNPYYDDCGSPTGSNGNIYFTR